MPQPPFITPPVGTLVKVNGVRRLGEIIRHGNHLPIVEFRCDSKTLRYPASVLPHDVDMAQYTTNNPMFERRWEGVLCQMLPPEYYVQIARMPAEVAVPIC